MEMTIEFLDEYVRTGKEKAGAVSALSMHLDDRQELHGTALGEKLEAVKEDVIFVLRAQKLVEKTEGKIASAEKRGFATPLEIHQAKEQLLASSKLTNLALDDVLTELRDIEKEMKGE